MANKAKTAFDRSKVMDAIAESVIGIGGVQAHKDNLNSALRAAKAEGLKWGRADRPDTMAADIAGFIRKRSANPDSLKVTLCTVKWCYENSVVLTTTTLSAMKKYAAKGAVDDLMTGKPKKIAAKGSSKGKAAKVQATVKHCGYGILQATEQAGFVKWLNHFFDKAEMMGVDSTSADEEKLDLVRSTLVDCGYAIMEDGEFKVKTINVSDDEVADDE